MVPLVTDVSGGLAAAASIFGVVAMWRGPSGRRIERGFVLGLALVAAWALAIDVVVRDPLRVAGISAFLAVHCAVSAFWWYLAARLATGGPAGAIGPWRVPIWIQAGASVVAAVAAGSAGTDWITGIGSEPTVVLSRTGVMAVGASTVPALVGLAILGRVLAGGSVGLPVLLVGVIGAMVSALWTSVGMLWRGYFTVGSLVSPAVVASVGALLWAVGLVWPAAARRPAPSRRFVFDTVAVAMVVAYLLAARSVVTLAGQIAAGVAPALPVVVGALAVAALLLGVGSQRVRHRLWGTVGRHLFRSKHDYGEVWIQLTELIARAKEQADLLQRAAKFCRDLLYVSEASVWVVGSTGGVTRVAATRPDAGPAEITTDADGAAVESDPTVFARAAGCGIASPLRLNGRVLGFLTVGVPGETERFDDEDRRVLRYVAAQVASAVALHRSGEEIADAREVASFHRLSAFVIHDLKNLVAQQSFVLQNAPKYRDDPAFVADALAAFDDSTNRMRGLIARLRARETGGSTPVAATPWPILGLIDELVAMPRLARRAGCRVRVVAPGDGAAGLVAADRNAMAQVLGNLLVNAVESLPEEGGDIVVRVESHGADWRISVSDTGCGIPEDFRRDHLFRPFRTTKHSGLGIGLYQCRSLVEAAGGTITVRSREGQGTEVTVLLPAVPPPGPASDASTTRPEDPHAEAQSAHR